MTVDADTDVVVAAGAWTPKILWSIGVMVPIVPMKGYCIAVDLDNMPPGTTRPPTPSDVPSRTVYDRFVYITRLGEQVNKCVRACACACVHVHAYASMCAVLDAHSQRRRPRHR